MEADRGEELPCLFVQQKAGDDGAGPSWAVQVHWTHTVCLLELQREIKGEAEDALDIWSLHAFRDTEEVDIVSMTPVF
ncbi:hypothetical protein NDU88_006314 [Pleurodeles waltl]|uniref:Uncharacterized protein n=1 Tax=Pleurodeles waltl TaxID=8319 RepID=A0AAV7TZ73_PLEWA|nr:hypothetical protein NDU88_006314 [Pleurodeles waltl]